jgi:hypothetical protein
MDHKTATPDTTSSGRNCKRRFLGFAGHIHSDKQKLAYLYAQPMLGMRCSLPQLQRQKSALRHLP